MAWRAIKLQEAFYVVAFLTSIVAQWQRYIMIRISITFVRVLPCFSRFTHSPAQ